MYLSALKIENFRQFGQAKHGLDIRFNEGVTALVGENDSGKTAVIDATRVDDNPPLLTYYNAPQIT